MKEYSPEDIIMIIHSIRKVSIDEAGELDTWFFEEGVSTADGTFPEGIRSFVPESFTRELLELIQKHLTK